MEDFYKVTGQEVSLNHNTLHTLAGGGHTKAECNAKKSWITNEEAEEIIKVLIEAANWGYPLSQWPSGDS